MIFLNRTDAGRRLAAELEGYRAQEPVVLALPRGGVVVAYAIARALDAPLDVLVARKIGAPGHSELAIGAVAPGATVLNERMVSYLDVSTGYLERAIAEETREIERRERLYRKGRPGLDVAGKTVILVDDGLATGATASAAIDSLRRRRPPPARLVFAAPVCAPETATELRRKVDALICLHTPPEFGAVSLWYEHFAQTTDAEVLELLERARLERAAPPAPPALWI